MRRRTWNQAAIVLACLLVGSAGRLGAQTSAAADVLASTREPGDGGRAINLPRTVYRRQPAARVRIAPHVDGTGAGWRCR
jgi:hypothetical protein